MAELADAHGSGPCDYCSHEGSSPFSCILHQRCSKQFNTQEWRNWQTRTVQVRVTIAVMRVQVPFPAFYINDAANNLIRRNGGIGRRARFRSVWLLQSWGFKSLFLHHWNQQRISADFFVVKRKIGILTIYLFCVNNGIFLFISTIILWIHVIIFPIFVSSCLLCFISTIIFWTHVMNKM